MLTNSFPSQLLEAACQRFADGAHRRGERKHHLKRLGKGGDWRKVDDPVRVLRRLESLGLRGLAAELMASEEIGKPTRLGVPGRQPQTAYERILDGDDTLGAVFLRTGAEVSRSVGRVIQQSDGFGFGTGFMISPRLLMTNQHVLRNKADASAAAIQFDYLEDQTGRILQPFVFRLQPEVFFLSDLAFDYAIVAVASSAEDGTPLEGRGWNPLIAESGKAVVGERLNLVQHPGGKPQRLALRNNALLDVLDRFLHYQADTEPGSSGSPVFNDQWELTALHHSGVADRVDGRIMLRDGSPWNGSDATRHLIKWVANEGVRISRIVSDIRAKLSGSESGTRALIDAAFDARPTPASSGAGVPQAVTPGAWAGSTTQGPVIDADGVARWTIPLQVALQVGHAAKLEPQVPEQDRPGITRGGIVMPALPRHTSRPSLSADDGLGAALARVEDNAQRPYYDEAADWGSFEAYYKSLPNEATLEDWFQLFSKLVRESHAPLVRYDDARRKHLYPWIDLREGDAGGLELRSIYSGKNFSAEEILHQDFEAERLRQEAMLELFRGESAPTPSEVEARLGELEAAHPFNCEHVVPQSWFGKVEPMRGDLHHLFTCEWGCNSYRSNVPYWDFAMMAEESVREDCGRRETGKFEPAFGKGAAARATLYFLLRYPEEIGNAARELSADRLKILLHWHASDPAGRWEWHRNAGIQEAQGNRNPLIDFPDMAPWMALQLGFGALEIEGLKRRSVQPRPKFVESRFKLDKKSKGNSTKPKAAGKK